MKKSIIILFSIIITVMLNRCALADNQTIKNIPNLYKNNKKIIYTDLNKESITINSNYVIGGYPNNITFMGNVSVYYQGKKYLQADIMKIHKEFFNNKVKSTWKLEALGNVCYNDNYIVLNGLKGLINLNTKDIKILKGDYHILNHHSLGTADQIIKNEKEDYITLKNSLFKFSLPGFSYCNLLGTKMIYDYKKQIAKIWNARFKLKKMTIFYIPYLRFKLEKNRHSRFLLPRITYSSLNGFEFYFPYYYNNNSNIKFKIILHYIDKYNSFIITNKMNYLTRMGFGVLGTNYIISNGALKYHNQIIDDNRYHQWQFYWKHWGLLDKIWSFNVDFTKTNYPNYLNNFNYSQKLNVDNYDRQKFSVRYTSNKLNAIISSKQSKITNLELDKNYSVKPQIDINWNLQDSKLFSTKLYAQAAYFSSLNSEIPRSVRLHLEPSTKFFLKKNWINFNIEGKIMATHYQQKNIHSYNRIYGASLQSSANRIIPEFKVNSKLIFEDNSMLNRPKILEPQIQYIYIPNYNQSSIQNYDSSFTQSNYNDLFSNKTLYNGLDYIPSINQFTIGITTHTYNNIGNERLSFSVGQIFNFNKFSNVYFKYKKNNKINLFSYAGNIYYKLSDYWKLHATLDYNVMLNHIAMSNGTVEYYSNKNYAFQLIYRYVYNKYVNEILFNSNINQIHKEGVFQVGGIVNLPVTNRLSITGGYYLDSKQSFKQADQMINFKYTSNYYLFSIGYKLKSNFKKIYDHAIKHDSLINLNIQLRDINFRNCFNSNQNLKSNIIPYRVIL